MQIMQKIWINFQIFPKNREQGLKKYYTLHEHL